MRIESRLKVILQTLAGHERLFTRLVVLRSIVFDVLSHTRNLLEGKTSAVKAPFQPKGRE